MEDAKGGLHSEMTLDVRSASERHNSKFNNALTTLNTKPGFVSQPAHLVETYKSYDLYYYRPSIHHLEKQKLILLV